MRTNKQLAPVARGRPRGKGTFRLPPSVISTYSCFVSITKYNVTS